MYNTINIPQIGYQGSFDHYLQIFDHLPNTYLFIKDASSRFVCCNENFAKLLDTDVTSIKGKNDYDFWEKHMADLYVAEDREVLAGKSFTNVHWMVPDMKGIVSWVISNKIPLYDLNGNISGICGLFRDLYKAGAESKKYFDLAEVVEYINRFYSRDISSQDLANIIGVSVSQLNRKFNKAMGMSPINYLISVRIEASKKMLLESTKNITEISFDCGFNNQTYFNRQFKRITGLSPRQFRRNIG